GLDENVDERLAGMAEYRTDERLQHRRREFKMKCELDLASRRAKREKAPCAVEPSKRSLLKLDHDAIGRDVVVGGGEVRAHAVVVDIEPDNGCVGCAGDDFSAR